jgi:hypothetical protein
MDIGGTWSKGRAVLDARLYVGFDSMLVSTLCWFRLCVFLLFCSMYFFGSMYLFWRGFDISFGACIWTMILEYGLGYCFVFCIVLYSVLL